MKMMVHSCREMFWEMYAEDRGWVCGLEVTMCIGRLSGYMYKFNMLERWLCLRHIRARTL